MQLKDRGIKLQLINPRIGFSQLTFGMQQKEVLKLLGAPQEKFVDEENDLIFQYPEKGISLLCFDVEMDYRLSMIELNKKSNSNLFGYEIFMMSLDKIKAMFHQKNIAFIRDDSINEKMGQLHFYCEELVLDFYFSLSKQLEDLMLGVPFNAKDQVLFPSCQFQPKTPPPPT